MSKADAEAALSVIRDAALELETVGVGHGHTHSAEVRDRLMAIMERVTDALPVPDALRVPPDYMPVPRCGSCRWWSGPTLVRDMGTCQGTAGGFAGKAYVFGEGKEPSLATSPDFGCVQHEAR
jgi:hypothetical protein